MIRDTVIELLPLHGVVDEHMMNGYSKIRHCHTVSTKKSATESLEDDPAAQVGQ